MDFTQSRIPAERISIPFDKADEEASTPTEETSLNEVNRILDNWISRPSVDHQNRYQAVKANLKAGNGATPNPAEKEGFSWPSRQGVGTPN